MRLYKVLPGSLLLFSAVTIGSSIGWSQALLCVRHSLENEGTADDGVGAEQASICLNLQAWPRDMFGAKPTFAFAPAKRPRRNSGKSWITAGSMFPPGAIPWLISAWRGH